MKILSRKEIKEIEEKISNVYGTEKSLKDYVVLVTSSKEKIWLASKRLFELDLEKLRVNAVGMYFGRVDRGKLRMSVEGAGIIGPNAKRNIAEIDEETLWDFLRGFDVSPSNLTCCDEFENVIVKCGDEWLGVAKLENNILVSVLPKSRKITSLTK